jgi:TorA maturation chaperone TorD
VSDHERSNPSPSDHGATDEPPVDLLRALAVIAEPPGSQHERLGRALRLGGPLAADLYSDLFLFQVYPYASIHVGAEGMLGGDARERIAGFWRAVGRVPPGEPDHLASLLGLYAGLAEEERAPRPSAERLLVREARGALLYEHLAPWVFAFLERVRQLGRGAYARWAVLLTTALRDEVQRRDVGAKGGTPAALPRHLTLAPPLPDPRVEGGAAFLEGVLAPVRSGMIVTRADLARLAGRLDLGLRAGERRYALEHLLAQDGANVLAGLAAKARARAAEHRAMRPWLGSIADFHACRAATTADLLDDLAAEHASAATPAPESSPPAPGPEPETAADRRRHGVRAGLREHESHGFRSAGEGGAPSSAAGC